MNKNEKYHQYILTHPIDKNGKVNLALKEGAQQICSALRADCIRRKKKYNRDCCLLNYNWLGNQLAFLSYLALNADSELI